MAKRASRSHQQPPASELEPSPLRGVGLEGGSSPDTMDGEKTGRMILVNLNPSSRSDTQSMLNAIQNSTGLGSQSSAVCSSADYGASGIDAAEAESAEVVVLERLGVALLNGDADQQAAAATAMMTSVQDSGFVVEPEYIYYALGYDSGPVTLETPGTSMYPLGDQETLRLLLQLMTRFAGPGCLGPRTWCSVVGGGWYLLQRHSRFHLGTKSHWRLSLESNRCWHSSGRA